MMSRTYDQIMGFWLNEPAVLDHQLIVDGIRDLAESGYGIVRIMFRNSNFCFMSPEVVEAVSVAVETGHKHGVKVVLDSEPHRLIAREVGRRYPGAIATRLFRAETEVVNGYFKLHVPCDRSMAEMLIFEDVEAAFIQQGDQLIQLDELDYQINWEKMTRDDGFSCYQQDFVANATIKMSRHTQLSGRLSEITTGKLITYIRFRDNELVDFAAEEFVAFYRELLDCYKHIPLDGVCWDEPALGGDWSNYRYGNYFAEWFHKQNGYQLRDKLYLLDNGKTEAEAVNVRLDYYRALNESLFEAQTQFYDYARKLFGQDLILGTHHTWQGEGGGNDYRAGAVDYFRLNDMMDAGYTDCCWWDQKSVAYSYTLGSSLGRLTPGGICECNTWHWKPTNAQVKSNARLMSLMNINWFNIWYGNNADTCMYPGHYTWQTAVEAMQGHKQVQKELAGALPVVDIAVLHDWHTIAGVNSDIIANMHKAFCMNLSTLALNSNLAFDFIDSRLLEAAQVAHAQLTCELGRYSCLVVPFASVLTKQTWDNIRAFLDQGGKVVFAGPPPTVDDQGNDLTEQFAELFDSEPLAVEEYHAWFKAVCTALPNGRPDCFDPAFPVVAAEEQLIYSEENEIIGMTSKTASCVYCSGYEASDAVLTQLETWTTKPVSCYGDGLLWRHYQRENDDIVVVIAGTGSNLSGIVQFEDETVLFEDGTRAVLSFQQKQPVKVSGDNIVYKHVNLSVKDR